MRSAKTKTTTKQGESARYPSGCLSDISVPPTLDRTYFDAVKIYAELRAPYPAVVAASGLNIDCDYSVTGVGVDDYSVHDLSAYENASLGSVAIGDDDIEACGYLGWLRL